MEDRRYGIYDFRRYLKKPLTQESLSSEDSTSYIVNCLCGVAHDDGQQMIECEKCKEWVHTACLEAKEKIPISEIAHYVCWKCQESDLTTIREDTSSISEYDVWFPLQVPHFQSKGHRQNRRPRSEFNTLRNMMRSFQEPKLTQHKTLKRPIRNENPCFVTYNGGLSVTTAAYILTEQLKTIQADFLQSNPKKQRFTYYSAL